MPLKIPLSKDDSKKDKKEKEDAENFSVNEDHLQKEKHIYDCLKSDACTDKRIKLIDCFRKTDVENMPISETCNTELLKMINCVNECVEKSKEKK
ncbi:hypothetical protein AVEN_47452-1 [Araneus ventricosus]|uniref:Ubiquinol-cytochrome C reductase hinge domain-containing protein n=1 Tax=Araneus ventricosus TaxID=182803 RepID=A0A4Y2IQ43_ARAVE|nr:hypothetical protein AVEN_47452-1 [Araneus ventricosus]